MTPMILPDDIDLEAEPFGAIPVGQASYGVPCSMNHLMRQELCFHFMDKETAQRDQLTLEFSTNEQ